MKRHFGFGGREGHGRHEGHDHDCGGRERFMRGGFGPMHAMGGRGRRGGGGRFFDQGDLRLVILALIAEAPSHGYQLIKTLEERTGGAYAPSPGVVYPTLTLLEEQGLIEQAGTDGAKKLFSITEAGAEALKTEAAAVAAFTERLQGGGDRRGGFSPKLMRARENLKTALRLKMMTGPLSDEQIDRVVAALDAAAKGVEEA